jgi:hypothetical protein
MMHGSVSSEIQSGFDVIKNETLYNISLESPLLRDADILSDSSISLTWRGIILITILTLDASLKRNDAFKERISLKLREGDNLLETTETNLSEIMRLESEAEALGTLGENVL